MCIRDRRTCESQINVFAISQTQAVIRAELSKRYGVYHYFCLLYTSDAADERSSVDLGGRRIIKKNTKKKIGGRGHVH